MEHSPAPFSDAKARDLGVWVDEECQCLGSWRQQGLGVQSQPGLRETLSQLKREQAKDQFSEHGVYLASTPGALRTGFGVHVCNPSTKEVEAGGWGVEENQGAAFQAWAK